MRDAKGFTLVEMVVAIAVAMGLLTAVYLAINSTQRHSSSIERKVTAQQDVKPALDIMALEIGMASYNPTFAPIANNLWVNSTTCTSTGTTQTYRGIQEATANSIAVEMDISGSGSTPDDGNGALGEDNEIIRYDYDTANQRITRATSCESAQSFLGGTVAGQKTVRVINSGSNGLGIPIFRYYDGTGNEITVSGNDLGGRIPDIRRIEIVLAVETENNDANTNQPRRLIYSTSVIPRNHAIQ